MLRLPGIDESIPPNAAGASQKQQQIVAHNIADAQLVHALKQVREFLRDWYTIRPDTFESKYHVRREMDWTLVDLLDAWVQSEEILL